MLELSIKEKERIGKLLKYYRKKNKVQWKEIESILSKSTYWKLENGKISKKIEIYNKLFNLYNLTYLKKDNFKEWFNDYLIRMNDALEYCKEEEYDSLIDELEKELGPYKNTIIYEQYYQVITYILNYYQYSKYMTMEEIEDCFLLFDCFDFEETIMIYLLETISISNTNVHFNYELGNRLTSYINKINHPIMFYHIGYFHKRNGDFEKALSMYDYCKHYWEKNKNVYRYIHSLMGEFIVYKNIDKSKATEIISIFNDLKTSNKISQTMLPRLNYNIAMFYYMNYEYEKALSYFLENINNFKEYKDLVLVCSICTQLDYSIPSIINDICILDHPHKNYLNYYKMKYLGEKTEKLVDYIFKDIIPNELNHQIYEHPFWRIFEEELLHFSRKDKRYAMKLVEYIEKKKKICKKG